MGRKAAFQGKISKLEHRFAPLRCRRERQARGEDDSNRLGPQNPSYSRKLPASPVFAGRPAGENSSAW